MRLPDPATLLDAWENGLTQSPQQRLLTLISTFMPEETPEQIAAMPVGRCDAALLEFHENMFGDYLEAVATCPKCAEKLEARIAVSDLRMRSSAGEDVTRRISAAGHRLSFRLPSTQDLLAIAPHSTVADARRALLSRCVIEARGPAGGSMDPCDLPEPVTRALAGRLAKLDPQANLTLSLVCPACGVAFAGLLDIATFVLRRLHSWAQRLLLEIHALASAYGWSEAQILCLSTARRDIYLEMVAS